MEKILHLPNGHTAIGATMERGGNLPTGGNITEIKNVGSAFSDINQHAELPVDRQAPSGVECLARPDGIIGGHRRDRSRANAFGSQRETGFYCVP